MARSSTEFTTGRENLIGLDVQYCQRAKCSKTQPLLQYLLKGDSVMKLDLSFSIVKSPNHVWLFATPWTVAHQAPPSLGFSRQGYWSGWPPFPSPGDIPDPGIEPGSPALQADALTSEPPGKPPNTALDIINIYIDHVGLLSAQMVKNPPSMQEIHAPSLGQKIPWRREQPTPVFLPGEVHGQNRAWLATIHGVEKSRTWLSN